MENKEYVISKIHEIKFIDKGIYGDIYKEEGEKYYSVRCTIKCEEENYYNEIGNIKLHLNEENLNRILNEPFCYDKTNNEIIV